MTDAVMTETAAAGELEVQMETGARECRGLRRILDLIISSAYIRAHRRQYD